MEKDRSISGTMSFDEVDITHELQSRPARAPALEAENTAIRLLLEEMANPRVGVLELLSETAMRLCGAQSAGVSILEEDEDGRERFRWHAATGRWSILSGQNMPRHSPCGVVVDRQSTILMQHPERYFQYSNNIPAPIQEALLVPFHIDGRAVGTVWVIAHEEGLRFEREDERLLGVLSHFASIAYNEHEKRERLSRSEQRNRLLARELSHRAKNLLSIVQALMSQSASRAETLEEFQRTFRARLHSLAASHDAVFASGTGTVKLDELVKTQTLSLVEDASDCIVLEGPELHLDAASAQIIGMALHELSTNSVKYGALSDDAGGVVIRTRIFEEDGSKFYQILWSEHGGPPAEEPAAAGFGSMLLKRVVPSSTGGKASLEYLPHGLTWNLIAPIADLP